MRMIWHLLIFSHSSETSIPLNRHLNDSVSLDWTVCFWAALLGFMACKRHQVQSLCAIHHFPTGTIKPEDTSPLSNGISDLSQDLHRHWSESVTPFRKEKPRGSSRPSCRAEKGMHEQLQNQGATTHPLQGHLLLCLGCDAWPAAQHLTHWPN